MEIIQTELEDCYIIKLPKFGDDRGYFLESFNKSKLFDAGIDFEVKQINFAKSSKNVLRGLHYQKAPFEQAKLVSVISGAVFDVAVDIRPESPSYLRHVKVKLDDPSTLFLVPRGFAHGYYTLENNTIFNYAVDNYYSPESEAGIRFDDESLNIDWGATGTPLISEKDLNQPYLNI
ncbi:MAG: dTDP-4-dehydrorhamnose 3,5-epimerase [Cyclobacteriaceae bacterium]